MFISRVRRTISAGHFVGPEGHKCRTQHGHDFIITVEFRYREVDPDTGWGPDFGAIKKIIDRYDHKNLNDEEPFNLGSPASSENLAKVLYEQFGRPVYSGGVGLKPFFVEVHEGHENSVRYYDDRPINEPVSEDMTGG